MSSEDSVRHNIGAWRAHGSQCGSGAVSIYKRKLLLVKRKRKNISRILLQIGGASDQPANRTCRRELEREASSANKNIIARIENVDITGIRSSAAGG